MIHDDIFVNGNWVDNQWQ